MDGLDTDLKIPTILLQGKTTFSTLRIDNWDASDLVNRVNEAETFLVTNTIDILLVSETHFTEPSYLRSNKFNICDTEIPDGKAHEGSAVLVKDNVKHHKRDKTAEQSTPPSKGTEKDKCFGKIMPRNRYPDLGERPTRKG